MISRKGEVKQIKKVEIVRGQMIHSIDDFRNGLLNNLMILEGEGSRKMRLKIDKLNFQKIIVDDNFGGATNVYSVDLNQDGRKDIIAAAVYADKFAWWQNMGGGRFIRFIIQENFDGATFVYAEDINGDTYKDILVPAVFDNQIGLWINRPYYLFSGNFVSAVINKREDSKVLNLSWDSLPQENAFLRFQIRSANNREELEMASWHGPSAGNNYYTLSGSSINPIHNGHRLLQYRVFFETNDPSISPSLNNVIIDYESKIIKK